MVEVAGLEHEVHEPGCSRAHEWRRRHVDDPEAERQDEDPPRPQVKTILEERALRFDIRRARGKDACGLDFHWSASLPASAVLNSRRRSAEIDALDVRRSHLDRTKNGETVV